MYTDTLFSETQSLGQNTCGQVYVTDFNFVELFLMRKKSDVSLMLETLTHDYRIFNNIIPDNAPELTLGEFHKCAHKFRTRIRPIEAWTPNQNKAEAAIRELKRSYRHAMRWTNTPTILWVHCMQLMAQLRSHTALTTYELEGTTPITGDTPDISHLVEFSWYQIVWYSNPRFEGKRRCLGPSRDIGQAMCSKILTEKGKIVSRSSVWPISSSLEHDIQQ